MNVDGDTCIGNDTKNSNLTVKGRLTVGSTISAGGAITASNYNANSDIRLKQNITDFNYTKSILDLPVKEYEYIADESHIKHIGCIAQDLQQLYPELVHENEQGYLTIEENKLVYLLLEEVKQLKEEIKSLKGE